MNNFGFHTKALHFFGALAVLTQEPNQTFGPYVFGTMNEVSNYEQWDLIVLFDHTWACL